MTGGCPTYQDDDVLAWVLGRRRIIVLFGAMVRALIASAKTDSMRTEGGALVFTRLGVYG